MAQEYRIDTVLVTNRVRLNNDAGQGVIGLPSAAWYGEPAIAGVRIDDPFGELDLRGWHTFTQDETSCTGNERTFSGWITGKNVTRGGLPPVGAARVWECEVIDLNAAFSFEVFRASSAKRPEETDIERVAWAQASAPMAGTPLHDNGRFNITDNPIGFGPADYVTQKPQGLFESVAGTSGKNFYAYFDQTANEPSLFYDLIAAAPASTLRISNVISDADSTTFYPFIDGALSRSPENQYTGELLGYLGGNYVYDRNDALIAELSPTEFSPVNFLRDNVKTTDRIGKLTTAQNTVAADLAAAAVEVDTITCAIRVPASQVNLLMAGDLVDAKFSHLPGYEDFVTMPVTRRNVIPSDGRRDMYDLHLTLSNEINAIGPGGGDPGEGPFTGGSCEIGDATLEHWQGVVVATQIGITDSWTFTITSAPTPGNLMWVAWYANDISPPSPGAYSMPGWTWRGQENEIGIGGGPGVVNVFTKEAESGESLTPVVNNTAVATMLAPELYAYMEWSRLGELDTVQTTNVPTGFTGQCTTVHTPTTGVDCVIMSAAVGNQGNAYPSAGTAVFGGTIVDESLIAVDAIGNAGYQVVTNATGSYITGTDRLTGTAHAGVSVAFLPCEGPPPGALMHVKNEFVADGDGTTTSFTTRYPYVAGSLEVFVDGVPIINGYTEIDPDAGTFSLDFAPQAASGDTRAERLTVNYQASPGS